MKLTSNVRNIWRQLYSPINFGSVPGGGQKINVTPIYPPAGSQAAAPDTITQTWRSNPSLGTWRPLGDITESQWTATPITWNSSPIGPDKTGVALTATVELPEILSMVGCPAAIFFSISVSLGIGTTDRHSDWNCVVYVANIFNTATLYNPGVAIGNAFGEFTGCVYGNLRKNLRDTRIAITMNGFYNDGGELQGNDFLAFNLTGSALSLT